MAETISMPKLGFDMAEGTLVRWVKQVGENINKGDVLAEIETDKATVEVESSASGVVLQHIVDQGTVVPVNAPIAVVGAEGEKVEAPKPEGGKPKAEEKKVEEPKAEVQAAEKPASAPSGAAPAQPTPCRPGAPSTPPSTSLRARPAAVRCRWRPAGRSHGTPVRPIAR